MKQNRLKILLICLTTASVLISSTLTAQKGPKEVFDFPKLNKIKMPKIHEVILPNNMRIFLVEDHDFPTIDVRALIRTGSVFEPAEKIGLAEITGEVIRSGGSKKFPGDELDKMLETMAASVETGIGSGLGYASISVLKEDIEKGLEILSDLLMNPAFPDDKIELAKIQHRSAISRRNDDIGSITSREFRKLIYGKDSPYARHAEYSTIEAITREDIVSFHEKYFHPNNIMMAVWGDFKWKEMKNKIQKWFGNWKEAQLNIPKLPGVEYKFDYSVNYIEKTDVNQSNIMLGHIGGLMNNPDYPALIIMNQILSFDRMFKKIRTDEGLAYSVYGSYGSGYRTPGIFSCSCQTKSESTVKAIRLMLEEIRKIQNSEVTDEELEKAKSSYLNSYVFNFDSKSKIINRLMNYIYYEYPRDFMEKVKEGVEKVTKSDVMRVARKYLKPDMVRILVVGNKKYFDEPLSNLGNVNIIDITIPPPPGEEIPEANAESLEKGQIIMSKVVDAIGGLKSISEIKNIRYTTLRNVGKMSMKMDITISFPDRCRIVLDLPMGKIDIVLTENEAWQKSPQGIMDLPAVQKKMFKEILYRNYINIFSDYDQKKIQYIGRRRVENLDVEDLLITVDDYKFHLLVFPDSYKPAGYIYTSVGPQGPQNVTEIIKEFKNVAGVEIPIKSVATANGSPETETDLKDIEVNIQIDPDWFKKN